MTQMPYEFVIGGVYLPPLLIDTLLGIAATLVTVNLLNRYRLSQYFFYPQWVFIALIVIYIVIFGTFVLKG